MVEGEERTLEELEDKDEHVEEREHEEAEASTGELVEVIFKGNRRMICRILPELSIKHGTYVIVEADKGEDLGRLWQRGEVLRSRRKGKQQKQVLRAADERELARWRQLRTREEEAYREFQRRVGRRKMPMKPVDVEYQLDGKKICFYFTAEHRVDFRELVRELAGVYRTRIELRQIGVRDEAKRLGGVGACGRELCCSTFLSEFAPITSQLAREQNLSLNPTKLSGLCGRLKCCLRFEQEFYRHAQGRFPKIGSRFLIGEREGKVYRVDFFHDTFAVRFPEGEERTMSLAAFNERGNGEHGLAVTEQ